MVSEGYIFTTDDIKFPTVMKSIGGVIVLAMKPGRNDCVFVGTVLKDESRIPVHTEGDIIDVCYLSIFGKYNQAVELLDGTVVRNNK